MRPLMQSTQSDREREELRLYLEWKTAKTGLRQEAALFGLWQACRPATIAAVRRLAEQRLGSKKNEHATVPAWLRMHSLTLDEAHAEVFPAVLQAAQGFRPEKGNKFSTYAHAFILGRLYRATARSDALNKAQPWSDGLNGRLSLDEAEDVSASLWDIFELDPHDGGLGKHSDRGALLDSLDASALRKIRTWLEENEERAVATYGFGRWRGLWTHVSLMALGKQMPPEVRSTDYFANKAKGSPKVSRPLFPRPCARPSRP